MTRNILPSSEPVPQQTGRKNLKAILPIACFAIAAIWAVWWFCQPPTMSTGHNVVVTRFEDPASFGHHSISFTISNDRIKKLICNEEQFRNILSKNLTDIHHPKQYGADYCLDGDTMFLRISEWPALEKEERVPLGYNRHLQILELLWAYGLFEQFGLTEESAEQGLNEPLFANGHKSPFQQLLPFIPEKLITATTDDGRSSASITIPSGKKAGDRTRVDLIFQQSEDSDATKPIQLPEHSSELFLAHHYVTLYDRFRMECHTIHKGGGSTLLAHDYCLYRQASDDIALPPYRIHVTFYRNLEFRTFAPPFTSLSWYEALWEKLTGFFQ